MTRQLSLGLIITAIGLVLVAVLEHALLRVEIVKHLAIILGIIALILAAVGVYGLVRGSKPRA